MKRKIQETLTYTHEYQIVPKKNKKTLRKLLFTLLFISILIAAGCALIYGIRIAKVL